MAEHEHGAPPAAPVEVAEVPADHEHEPVEEVEKQKSHLEIFWNRDRGPDDWKDQSFDPSYTTFEVPYYMKCRDRYHKTMQLFEHQFHHEIHQIMLQQSSAFEAARLVRHLSYTTLWPPLHNFAEFTRTQRYFFRLTSKQQKRLKYIMSTKFQ